MRVELGGCGEARAGGLWVRLWTCGGWANAGSPETEGS